MGMQRGSWVAVDITVHVCVCMCECVHVHVRRHVCLPSAPTGHVPQWVKRRAGCFIDDTGLDLSKPLAEQVRLYVPLFINLYITLYDNNIYTYIQYIQRCIHRQDVPKKIDIMSQANNHFCQT